MDQGLADRVFKTAITLVLLIFFALALAGPVNFVTADLGRHIKNGELFLTSHLIPQTNFYSYAHSDYPFVNHHWGTGVIFYLLYQGFGFAGFSWFLIIISLATFLLFFNIAVRNSRFEIAAFVFVITIPLLVSRVEIRPELFSYFL